MMFRNTRQTVFLLQLASRLGMLLLLLFFLSGCGTSRKASKEPPAMKLERRQYIEKYAPLAQEEMKRTGIPASITMAQALLESNDGNSYLAVYGKNHFGIKCHRDWRGKKIYYDDDAKHECFRKYNNVEESYRDHSDFLMDKDRYAFLFKLDPTDYKGWAKGLKKAGYATNPHYAQMLIKIIEDYHLYDLDTKKYRPSKSVAASREALDTLSHDELVELALARDTVAAPEMSDEFVVSTGGRRQVLMNNRVNYIIVRKGDTFESLTKELGLVPGELPKYNELDKHDTLRAGQILYLQPKRRQAEQGKKEHIVKEGETMYSISQQYAVRLKYLYEMNGMKPGEEPRPGQKIRLRK
jgi:LysM repeat protein